MDGIGLNTHHFNITTFITRFAFLLFGVSAFKQFFHFIGVRQGFLPLFRHFITCSVCRHAYGFCVIAYRELDNASACLFAKDDSNSLPSKDFSFASISE